MVFDFLKARKVDVPEAKASATGRVIAWGGSGRVAWSPRDTVSLTRAGFPGNPVGFRSVKLIAEAAAALPLVCRMPSARYEMHPVLGLLSRPNGAQGKAELFEALYGQLLLSGDGYLEAVGGETGLPLELHVLRSDRMSVVPGADGWPVAYDYAVGGEKHRFDVGEGASPICHIKNFHPAGRSLRVFTDAGGGDLRWMCTTARRAGRRRCWTMPHGRRARLSTRGPTARVSWRRISMTGC